MKPVSETKQRLLVCVLLSLSILAVYWPVRHFEFLTYDDPQNVSENVHVLPGLTWSGVKWAFVNTEVDYWKPVTWLSHMLDCQWFGLNAGAHHLENVLWHAVNALLLFVVLHRMTGSIWRSAFASALFALHPLRIGSVAWITERKDVPTRVDSCHGPRCRRSQPGCGGSTGAHRL